VNNGPVLYLVSFIGAECGLGCGSKSRSMVMGCNMLMYLSILEIS